jgi:hypothetical protein
MYAHGFSQSLMDLREIISLKRIMNGLNKAGYENVRVWKRSVDRRNNALVRKYRNISKIV